MKRLSADARSSADTAVTALLVSAFAFLPLLEVRLTKTVAVADVGLAAAAVVLLVAGPMGRAPRAVLPPWIVAGLAMVAAGGLFALLFAPHPADSGVLLSRLLVAAALSLFVLLWWDPPARRARWLVGAYVMGATVSAGLGALSATVLEHSTEHWRDAIDRSTGLTGNANHLGAVTCIGMCLALGLAATSRTPRMVAVWLGATAVMGAGVLWSGSRSALIGFAVGALVVLARLWVERRRTPIFVAAGACLVVFLLALFGVVRIPAIDRLLLRTDTTASTYSVESTEARVELARERIDAAGADSLLVGAGMENRTSTGGHSGHLEIWVGTGLVGFAGWLVVCATTLSPVARAVRRGDALDERAALLVVVGAGFAAHVASTLFLEHIWDRYIWLLVALVVVLRPERAALEPDPDGDALEMS